MAINRAQVSLSFEDEELYNGLIVHLKKTKTLQKTILDCLTAFYYNDTVRQIVSGIEEEMHNGGQMEDRDAIFADIRNSLLVNDFIMDEFSAHLQAGEADISSIVEAVGESVRNLTPEEPVKTNTGVDTGLALLEEKPQVTATEIPTDVSKGMPSVSTASSDEKLNLLISMMQTMMENGHFVSDVGKHHEVRKEENSPTAVTEKVENEEDNFFSDEEPVIEPVLEEQEIEEPVIEPVVEQVQPAVVEPVQPEPVMVEAPKPVQVPHIAPPVMQVQPIKAVAPVQPVSPVQSESVVNTNVEQQPLDYDPYNLDDDFEIDFDMDSELASVDLEEEGADATGDILSLLGSV